MRHKLIPMLVAAGARATQDGTPVVRRLDLEWPEFAPASASNTEYLLGDDILLAPYSNGGGNYSVRKDVWIPPGDWIDAWTGEVVKGNGTTLITVNQSLDRMPMWHRSGGVVVTTASVSRNVARQDWSKLVLEAFPRRAGGAGFVTRRVVEPKQRLDGEQLLPHHVGKATVVMSTVDVNTVDLVASEQSVAAPDSTADRESQCACPREWVARFHLLAGEKIAAVLVDGKAVPVLLHGTGVRVDGGDSARDVRAVLLPLRQAISNGGGDDHDYDGGGDRARGAATMPFAGVGERPGAFAGPTLEVFIAANREKCGVSIRLLYE